MANSPDGAPLSPRMTEDGNSPATSASFAADDLVSPTRRRRQLSRFSPRSRGQTRPHDLSLSLSPSSFNPEAADFVPSTPTGVRFNMSASNKRKASSSARSGKSVHGASRNSPISSRGRDQPIIPAEELFGKDGMAAPKKSESSDDASSDDDESSEIFELEMQDFRRLSDVDDRQAPQQRDRVRDALSVVHHRVAQNALKAKQGVIQSCSAMLVMNEAEDAVADALGATTRLRYLPLCPATSSTRKESLSKDTNLVVQPRFRHDMDTSVPTLPSRASWPADSLPVEIFDLITDHLSRDDVKAMRLVSKEFEKKVSCALFYTSVVPFNTELYDMIDEGTKAVNRAPRPGANKGKGKAKAHDTPDQEPEAMRTGLHWQNAKEDAEGKVYKGHGLRVFQGFGPHIRRFGMSFEVAESQLSRPPTKKELDHVDSYHGSYDWPPHQYTRFANLAGLERTADETLRMKAAFSHLGKVQDLALSIDSGLGWLNGPDRSVRARIFNRPSAVFGQSRKVPDRQSQDAVRLWQAIQDCRGMLATGNSKEISLARKVLSKPPFDLPGLQGTQYANPQLWPTIAASQADPAITHAPALESRYGVLFTTSYHPDSHLAMYEQSALVPSDLRKEQKEWLLETEWAQRAFLECYVLAVIDNPAVFAAVKTLTIAKVSSRFLPLLARESFWDALPGLSDATIHVKPDWRSVEKDNAGFAETHNQNPSESTRLFHRCVLRDRICLRPTITKLNIGWTSGGEHAEGIFARNNHILPAPITQLEHSTAANASFGLVFKFVEELTLTNCWITPPTLEELIRNHARRSLKKLTLNSVSLTAHPRFPAGGQAGQQQHHLAQAILAMQANGGQALPAPLQNMFNQVQNQNQNQNNLVMHPANMQHAPQFNGQAPAPQQNPQALLHGQVGWQIQVQPAPVNPVNFQQQMLAQQQIFNFMNVGNLGNNAINVMPGNFAPAPAQAQQPPAPSHWTEGHREGSWPELLDKVSPGPIFTDYLPTPPPWEEQLPPREETALQSITFISCGYAKLTHNTHSFDQFALDAGVPEHHSSPWFRARQSALAPAMMNTGGDLYMAKIVQHLPDRERSALQFAWGLTHGWEDGEKAEDAEFDGLLPGGTGRFSGRIDKGMPLVDREDRDADGDDGMA